MGSTLLGNTDKASRWQTFALDKPLANGWYANLSYYTKATEVGLTAARRRGRVPVRLAHQPERGSPASPRARSELDQGLAGLGARLRRLDQRHGVLQRPTARSHLDLQHPGGRARRQRRRREPGSGTSAGRRPAGEPCPATPEQIAAFHESSPQPVPDSAGTIANRNGDRLPWVIQADGIQQELGFFMGHKSVIRLDIYNF